MFQLLKDTLELLSSELGIMAADSLGGWLLLAEWHEVITTKEAADLLKYVDDHVYDDWMLPLIMQYGFGRPTN